MYKIRFFEDGAGRVVVAEWLESLKDKRDRARIMQRIHRMETGNFGDHKPVGEGIFELRLHFGPGFRVYFGRMGKEIVLLLCAGDKSSQVKDIAIAKRNWQDAGGEEKTHGARKNDVAKKRQDIEPELGKLR